MAIWDLSAIRQFCRQITGRLTPEDITNPELDKNINRYYQYMFPAQVKMEKQHVYYQFLTSPNQPFYDVPETTYTNFEPPATANSLPMEWYQDPTYFFLNNPNQYTFLVPWTGNGVTTNFSTTVSGFPIYPATTTVSDGVESFLDTNQTYTTSNVVITGSNGGTLTLNYSTGTINVSFAVAPLNGANINFNYVVFNASRPQNILMYNNQFQFFPVPDQAYLIRMKAYKIVDALVNATDRPPLDEWGPCIAYGAAELIFSQYGEHDAIARYKPLYAAQISLIMTRTCENLMNTRATPTF